MADKMKLPGPNDPVSLPPFEARPALGLDRLFDEVTMTLAEALEPENLLQLECLTSLQKFSELLHSVATCGFIDEDHVLQARKLGARLKALQEAQARGETGSS